MRNFVLAGLIAVAVLLSPAQPMRGDNKSSEPAAMLDRIRTLQDLRGEDATPFVLEARIKATSGKQEGTGTYRLTWLAANRWREQLQLGDFSRVRDGVDGGYRQFRVWDYQPQVIFDIDKLLDVAALARLAPNETAGKVQTSKTGGVVSSCIEIRSKNKPARELCFDPKTGLLAHATASSAGPAEAFGYAAALSLGTKKFPDHLSSPGSGGFSLEISVVRLQAFSGQAASLPVPDPARSEFWAACSDIQPAELTKIPLVYSEEETFPAEATVSMYARIEADGTVSHLKELSAVPANLTLLPQTLPSGMIAKLVDSALEEAGRLKYAPAMCGKVPVPTETVISIVAR